MDMVVNKPTDKVRIRRRIIIRNPRSTYRRNSRMFDILVADKEVYVEFRTGKTDSEVMKVNDLIEQLRDVANEIENDSG